MLKISSILFIKNLLLIDIAKINKFDNGNGNNKIIKWLSYYKKLTYKITNYFTFDTRVAFIKSSKAFIKTLIL